VTPAVSPSPAPRRDNAPIKCVVWDLDDTIWDGVLLEDRHVRLRPAVADVIRRLDQRGILHSVASRNDAGPAMERLRAFGLDEFFLCPQINWNAKSESVQRIAGMLNIGLDAVAFVDDQPVERDEVAYAHPQVLCLGVESIPDMPEMPAFTPRFVTDDSRRRRAMMRASMVRDSAQSDFTGTPEKFLASLQMVFTVGRAREEDLRRAEELTLRTNQLNTGGCTYSYDELAAFSKSADHLLLMAGLDDRYGTYGRIGLALVARASDLWTIRLLLMSCRVMQRGVGTILLTHVMQRARASGARLQAEFVPTGRNRIMLVTYRLSGFRTIRESGGALLLEHDLQYLPEVPDYVQVRVED
jgi:FkbH-like protein